MKEQKEMDICYKVLDTIEHHTIICDFKHTVVDAKDMEKIKNMNETQFIEYFYDNIRDISFIEYEEDVIFDYVEKVLDILDYESTEDFEFDIYDFFRTNIHFEYSLENFLKNSLTK